MGIFRDDVCLQCDMVMSHHTVNTPKSILTNLIGNANMPKYWELKPSSILLSSLPWRQQEDLTALSVMWESNQKWQRVRLP
jgi:hypothetical protein